jgi:predicted regulator of Ras-like GTPase activity (Roadblock/LC7/MglB family)
MGASSSVIREPGEKAACMPVPCLDHLLKFSGVLCTLLIRSDGSVITRSGFLEADTEGLLDSISLLIAESGIIAGRIQNSALSQIFLEFENKFLVIQEVEYNRFLIIIARADTNIGQISYHLKKEKLRPVPQYEAADS